jgi:adenosylmethionine-8-amino-7-oxononanoate aminotransferase
MRIRASSPRARPRSWRIGLSRRRRPACGDIRGRGLLWGVEIVADRANKAPFDADLKLHARSKQKALGHGLLVNLWGGNVDGRSDQVLLAPPFIVTQPELETIVERLALAIDEP